jgi:iron complex transport system substrate-binding protein
MTTELGSAPTGRTFVRIAAAASTLAFCLGAAPAHEERLVTVGGTITEIVFALGRGGEVVGVDTSSVHPEEATRLPQVGYQRTLSAEGLLSLSPTLVLVSSEAGPPAALTQIRGAGVRLVEVATGNGIEAARGTIRAVAAALDRQQRGEELVGALDRDLARASAALAGANSRPRVLFVYSRGGSAAMVSGTGTAADVMIRLAGGDNAVTDYEGFRPLTPEAVVTAEPEVVLIPSRGLDALGGREALFALPGLGLTPAGREQRVVTMDDLYLLGFGPRTGQAVHDLVFALHPELR